MDHAISAALGPGVPVGIEIDRIPSLRLPFRTWQTGNHLTASRPTGIANAVAAGATEGPCHPWFSPATRVADGITGGLC